MKTFEGFKEITVGGLSKEQLLGKLISKGVQFNEYAQTLFKHPSFIPPDSAQTVKLAKVNLGDFDLRIPSSYQEFTRRALAFGLKLCPLYLGAFLRLEFLDQPEGPYLTIASEKPESDPNYPNGFYIRKHENILWLRGYQADDVCEWPKDNEFIFMM